MGRSVMKRGLQSYIDDKGRQYIEEHMPKSFIGKHYSKHDGIPIRMAVYDSSEMRKFIADPNKMVLRLSDDGIQGLVGFCDYYVKEDNGLMIGLMFVHPFHRNKNIANNMVLFMETLVPNGSTLDAWGVTSPYVKQLIETTTSRNGLTVRSYAAV